MKAREEIPAWARGRARRRQARKADEQHPRSDTARMRDEASRRRGRPKPAGIRSRALGPRGRAATLLLMLLLPLPGVAVADDESALYFLGRAREAIEAGDLDRASEFLEKSAKEKEGYAPTLFAFAQVAHRRGDPKTAVRFLEACLEQRKRADLSFSEREAIEAAGKLLAEVDEARAQFRKLVADYVGEVSRLARATNDAALARECWRAILVVDPENAEAKERLGAEAAGEPAAKPAGAVKTTKVFNGKDLDGLTRGSDWTVKGGVLRGRVADAAIMTRSEKSVKGPYTLVCEMRTKEDLAGNPRIGVLVGIKSLWDHFGFWVCDDDLRIFRSTGENQGTNLKVTRFPEAFDRKEWHVYRIRVDGRQITCSIDDQEIFKHEDVDRDLDGPVGLFVQEQETEFRRLVVEQAK